MSWLDEFVEDSPVFSWGINAIPIGTLEGVKRKRGRPPGSRNSRIDGFRVMSPSEVRRRLLEDREPRGPKADEEP